MASALQIGEIIGRILDADHQVWLTGHILGGALAVLLAATLLESGLPVHGLYTFGAPRVGDKKFARALNTSLQGVAANWRVVNVDDLVPHVPLESFSVTRGTGCSSWTTEKQAVRPEPGATTRKAFGAGSADKSEDENYGLPPHTFSTPTLDTCSGSPRSATPLNSKRPTNLRHPMVDG